MGVTRKELFTDNQNRMADMAKLLAHPARIAILEHILNTNSCITGDLVHDIGLAQATISQHLKEMKNAGIIQGRIEGVAVSYCIDQEKWDELRTVLLHLLDRKPGTDDSCC